MQLIMEKLSDTERDKLSPSDFVFPDRDGYPIQSAKQAKTALTYARWPDNQKDWPMVWSAVKKRWPAVAKAFKGGKFWKQAQKESRHMPTMGDAMGDKLAAFRSLIDEGHDQRKGRTADPAPASADVEPRSDADGVAAMFCENGMDETYMHGQAPTASWPSVGRTQVGDSSEYWKLVQHTLKKVALKDMDGMVKTLQLVKKNLARHAQIAGNPPSQLKKRGFEAAKNLRELHETMEGLRMAMSRVARTADQLY